MSFTDSIPADITQLVERRTHENNISDYYRVCGFESPGWPTEITNIRSDGTLKLGPV